MTDSGEGDGAASQAARLQRLASYVPRPVLRYLRAGGGGHEAPVERLDAAVLFADVSGFSSLAERLGGLPAGAERLSRVLNRYLSAILDRIVAQGGVPVDFAGDAVIAAWRVGHEVGSLEEAVRRAAGAAAVLRDELGDYQADEETRLSLSIGVGAGPMWSTVVVDPSGRSFFFFFSGSALSGAVEAQDATSRGSAAASPEAGRLLAGWARTQDIGEGVVRLAEVPVGGPPVPASPVDVLPEEVERLYAFMAPPVRAVVQAGHGGWLAELRHVSVGFLSLRTGEADPEGEARAIRRAVALISEEVRELGGAIVQLVSDDKGVTVVCAWGLPGQGHEDVAARAVTGLLSTSTRLREAGFGADVGVATGRLFCGDRGNDHRREYALVGVTMNRAARLMQAADGQVFCDPATHQEAKGVGLLQFTPTPPLKLKGFPEPVPAQEARRENGVGGSEGGTASPGPGPALVGRGAEVEGILRKLSGPRDGPGGPPAVLITGEAGVGKSAILGAVAWAAAEGGHRVLRGLARSLDRRTAYGAWGPILLQALGSPPPAGVERWLHGVLSELGVPDGPAQAPLLNPLLGLQLAETPFTRQLDGEGRLELTNRLVVELLTRSGGSERTLILLDDAQHLDSASWSLLEEMRDAPGGLALLLAARPPQEAERGEEWAGLLGWAREVELSALPEVDSARLLAEDLGCREVEEGLRDFVFKRAGGNPLFIREICAALRADGSVRVAGGRATLAAVGSRALPNLPRRIEGLVARRVDGLPREDQLVLKIASVVQRPFSGELLQDVHPLSVPREVVESALDRLQGAGLLMKETGERGGFDFAHTVVRDTAYGTLLFEQRQLLHASVAEWFEARDGDGLAGVHSFLAYHFTAGERLEKGVQYNDLAGGEALASYANREALDFLRTARECEERLGRPGPARLRSVRSERISEALLRIGDSRAAMEEAIHGLRTLGHGALNPWVGLPRSLTTNLVRHRARASGKILRKERPADAEARSLAYRLFDHLARGAYLDLDNVGTVHATLRCLEVAEGLGPSPELVQAYATVSLAFGLVPWHAGARFFGELCEEALEVTGERDSLVEAFARELMAVYLSGVGSWARADAHLQRALTLFERFGQETEVGMVLQQHARNLSHRADFQALAEVDERILGERRDIPYELAWGTNNVVEHLLAVADDPGEPLQRALDNLELVEVTKQFPGIRAVNLGLLAVAEWRAGAHEAALEAAERALPELEAGPPTAFGIFPAYWGTAATFLALEEAAPGEESRERARDGARRGLKQLRNFAKRYPIASARYLIYLGRRHWVGSRRKKALLCWDEALEHAVALEMPYEQALVHRALGAAGVSLGLPGPEAHRAEAAALLRGLGVGEGKVERMMVDPTWD